MVALSDADAIGNTPIHRLTPKTYCSQQDQHNPSEFGTMNGLANAMDATVLTVAFLVFVDIIPQVCIELQQPEREQARLFILAMP